MVEDWLTEHEGVTEVLGRTRRWFHVPWESVLGGLYMVWGMLLLFLFIFDFVFGGLLAIFLPPYRVLWAISVVLLALGAWLAFELSDQEGFDVSEEQAPPAASSE